jgi:hypothetical protein
MTFRPPLHKLFTTTAVALLLFVFSLSCRSKDKHFFASEQRYKHALFRGGYETLHFKPDGSVSVRMLINGVDVVTTGQYQRDRLLLKVQLPTGPKPVILFQEIDDQELVSLDTNHKWYEF